jgi:hypothetical protein
VQEKEMRQFMYQRRLLRSVRAIDGDIVECGVGWGRSLLYFALLAREEGKGRKVWGFDSFEGFPEPTKEDKGLKMPSRERWKVKVNEVINLMSTAKLDVSLAEGSISGNAVDTHAQVVLVKGFFDETLKKYSGSAIAVLHIDCDLYESYLGVLKELYPKVAFNGVVALDEYHQAEKWPGAKRAVDEYFGDTARSIVADKRCGKCYLVKETS